MGPRPGIDSLTSAFHFVSPALVGATIRPVAIAPELWLGCIAFMAWGMASHALGAVQDVLADRQAQLSSIATAWGARTVTRLAAVFYLLACAMVAALPAPAWLVAIAGLGYVAITLRFWNITDATSWQVNASWRIFLWLNYAVRALVTICLVAQYSGGM